MHLHNYKLLQTWSSCICRSNLILSIDSPSSISLAWLAVSLSSARDADSSVTCRRFQTLSNAVNKQFDIVQDNAYRPSWFRRQFYIFNNISSNPGVKTTCANWTKTRTIYSTQTNFPLRMGYFKNANNERTICKCYMQALWKWNTTPMEIKSQIQPNVSHVKKWYKLSFLVACWK